MPQLAAPTLSRAASAHPIEPLAPRQRLPLGPLVVILACAAITAAAMGAWSCAGMKTAATTVTDCAAAVAPADLEKALPVVEAALASARQPDGSIDLAPLLDVARTMSLAVGGCAQAQAFARAAAEPSPAFAPTQWLVPGMVPFSQAWAEMKARQYPGRSFRLPSGAVL